MVLTVVRDADGAVGIWSSDVVCQHCLMKVTSQTPASSKSLSSSKSEPGPVVEVRDRFLISLRRRMASSVRERTRASTSVATVTAIFTAQTSPCAPPKLSATAVVVVVVPVVKIAAVVVLS